MSDKPDPTADDGLVYHPEQGVLDEAGVDKMFCFLDQDRLCGPGCMAFVTYPKRSENSELADSQTHCSLLLAADRIGRNVTILASTLAQSEKRRKMADLDARREASTPKQEGPFAQPMSPFPKRST